MPLDTSGSETTHTVQEEDCEELDSVLDISDVQSHLETRLPTLWFRGVKIMQNVFDTSIFNVHLKTKIISANLPCRNNMWVKL